jgi:membrane-associated PAP2 superfamily phosphatase
VAIASTDSDAVEQAAFHGLWLALPLAIAAGLLVLDRMDLDLVLATRLYDPVARAFPLRTAFFFDTILHHWTKYVVVLLACLAWGGYLLTHAVPGMRSYRRELLFLGLALVLAPAAVAGLKLLSDRHCPWDVVQFGGFAPYLALLDAAPTGLTPGHCFPAGHATTGFSLMAFHFVGWSLAQRGLSWSGLTGGLVAGLGLGFGRMAQGAHFLSHVLWSGLVCWIVLVALYALILCPRTRVGRVARADRAVRSIDPIKSR